MIGQDVYHSAKKSIINSWR